MTSSTRLQFGGKGNDIFSKDGLKMFLWFISIIGLPIGMIYLYRWMARKTRNSATETGWHFTGTAEQLYPYVVASAVVSLLRSNVDTTTVVSAPAELKWFVAVVWALGLLFAQCAIAYAQFLWGLRNLEIASGLRVTFRGGLLTYVGWSTLYLLSFFSLIGWAWVGTASNRWLARNIEVPGYRVTFRGSGIGLLWRGVVGVACSILVLPIPWIYVMFCRWAIENTDMQPLAAEQLVKAEA